LPFHPGKQMIWNAPATQGPMQMQMARETFDAR